MSHARTLTDELNRDEVARALTARRERTAADLLGRDLTEEECDSLHADGCGELACVHCYPTPADLAALASDMDEMPRDPAPTDEELELMAHAAGQADDEIPW